MQIKYGAVPAIGPGKALDEGDPPRSIHLVAELSVALRTGRAIVYEALIHSRSDDTPRP